MTKTAHQATWNHNTSNIVGPFPIREPFAFIRLRNQLHGFAADSPCTCFPKIQEELAEWEGVSLSFWGESLSLEDPDLKES